MVDDRLAHDRKEWISFVVVVDVYLMMMMLSQQDSSRLKNFDGLLFGRDVQQKFSVSMNLCEINDDDVHNDGYDVDDDDLKP